MYMYLNNLKKLRLSRNLRQNDIANILKCKRETYATWENQRSMIPLKIADQLAMFYHVSLSYVLGLEKNERRVEYQPLNYDILLNNLLMCKIKYNHTYEDISNYLKCNKSTVNRYFNNEVEIKIDMLIALSNLYRTNLDVLCGKVIK